jgi:Fe-S-cluster-containing hydrogenase component 2
MIHCEVQLCVGCRMCEVACSSFHFGAVSPALSRIRVSKLEQTGIDMAIACVNCLEKPCLECPSQALSVSADRGILLESDLCDACELCTEVCPIGAVGFHNEKPLFCNLCGGLTSCVTACPTQSLSYREEHREVSLESFSETNGNPASRRAHYAEVQGKSVRDHWKKGGRVEA